MKGTLQHNGFSVALTKPAARTRRTAQVHDPRIHHHNYFLKEHSCREHLSSN